MAHLDGEMHNRQGNPESCAPGKRSVRCPRDTQGESNSSSWVLHRLTVRKAEIQAVILTERIEYGELIKWMPDGWRQKRDTGITESATSGSLSVGASPRRPQSGYFADTSADC